MSDFAAPHGEPGSVIAALNYVLATGETPIAYADGPGSPETVSGAKLCPYEVLIHDGRRVADRMTLDRNGFRFIGHQTKVVDFLDQSEIRSVYYPEIEAVVKAETGAARVLLFDATLRSSDTHLRDGSRLCEPVLRVHNDFTEESASQPVRDLLPKEAETLLRRHFAIFQVWRPIHHPVESFPLAIADASTILAANLVMAKRRYPNWEGQTYWITHHPGHRWYWFPRMRPTEALVFKNYDSITDGRARWTPHTTFVDPTAAAHARPRESIEIRAIAFY
jgi:hypothetical protein